MIKLVILSIIFTLGGAMAPIDFTVAQEWNFVKEEKGIKLYNRAIEGFEYKEVKAILYVRVDLEKAKNFLLNPSNIEKWMSGCTLSIPKNSGNGHIEYYTIFDAPWPVSDRDDYGRMTLKDNSANRLRIDFQSIPDGTPKVSSMVRVPFSKGNVSIDISEKGVSTLTYQFLVDRGGSLPRYLREYLENTSPINTIQSLKKSLEQL